MKKIRCHTEDELLERIPYTLQTILLRVEDGLIPEPHFKEDGQRVWSASKVESWIADRPVLIKRHIDRPDGDVAKASIRMR